MTVWDKTMVKGKIKPNKAAKGEFSENDECTEKFLVVPAPLHMTVHYMLKGLDKRTIERYEIEILIKKDTPLQQALHEVTKNLSSFAEECEGIVEIIVREQLARSYALPDKVVKL